MGKIYEIQPPYIELSYDILPGTIATTQIKYRNPAGKIGVFNAVLDTLNKVVRYVGFPPERLLDYGGKGTWEFWIFFTCSDGSTYPGEPYRHTIYKEGY